MYHKDHWSHEALETPEIVSGDSSVISAHGTGGGGNLQRPARLSSSLRFNDKERKGTD